MFRMFSIASTVAISMSALTAVAMTAPGFASEAMPTTRTPAPVILPMTPAPVESTPSFRSEAVVQTLPVRASADDAADETRSAQRGDDAADRARLRRAGSLAATVAAADGDVLDAQHRCLAQGVYYESKGEPLEGQLAVAEVIINRARSGRFANSVCGVLTQRGQFSFVRGGVIPQPAGGAQWRTAVAIARVALDDAWDSRASNALFFHATRVSPGWNRARVASIGNHVFYR